MISENEYSEIDAKVAFEALIIFTVFGNRFFEIEEAKMKLSPDSFKNIADVIKKYLKDHSNNVLLEGMNKILKQEFLLRELQTHLKDYINHYDNTILVHHKINELELRKLLETLAHLNRIQFLQGREIMDSFEKVKLMYREMKKHKLYKELTEYDQTILKEMAKSIKNTKESIKSLYIEKEIAHFPTDKQIEILVREFEKVGKEKLTRYKQDLRYPKY